MKSAVFHIRQNFKCSSCKFSLFPYKSNINILVIFSSFQPLESPQVLQFACGDTNLENHFTYLKIGKKLLRCFPHLIAIIS